MKIIDFNLYSVIFSVWTTTLEIIHQGLEAAGIRCCRYEGSMRYAKRTESLKQFQEDPTLSVILVSITCGGQGQVILVLSLSRD